eukprot:CAMPEP_0113577714 /NCGR_PEP_ID=MMETSP0015_2-20120614/29039_1 /TAXON_ID=2838 /ORGANISM="Odontella" /LENGTH=111 /DNA_ID=CAMNT_0000481359 /DNA_START=262 /DNA_END=594 /DNA_ORIENTATION=+ /assembly_acc=CAM_ASM_000160
MNVVVMRKHVSFDLENASIDDITKKSEELTIGPATVNSLNETDFLMPQRNNAPLYNFSVGKWMSICADIEAGKDITMTSDNENKPMNKKMTSSKRMGREKRLIKKNKRILK